jgi:hypothetical protein
MKNNNKHIRCVTTTLLFSAPSKDQLKYGPFHKVTPGTTGVIRDKSVDEYGTESCLIRLDTGAWTLVRSDLVQEVFDGN